MITPSTQLSTEWPLELSSPTGSYRTILFYPIPADTGMNQDGGNEAEGRVQTSTQYTA